MDQSLTSEKLNFLHSLLDKELEGLKESSLSNSGMHLGNGIENQTKIHQQNQKTQQINDKILKSQSSSIHLNSSINHQRDPLPLTPLESSLNISHQNHHHQRSNSQTPIKDDSFTRQFNSNQVNSNHDNQNRQKYPSYSEVNSQNHEVNSQIPSRHFSNHQDPTKNIRMSHDLQELQNKIMNLEKKIVSINNPQQFDDKENSYIYQEGYSNEQQNFSKDLIEHSFSKNNKYPSYDRHETNIDDGYDNKQRWNQNNNMFETFNNQNIDSSNQTNNKMTRKSSKHDTSQNNMSSINEMSDDSHQNQHQIKKNIKQKKTKQDEDDDEDTPLKRKYKNKQINNKQSQQDQNPSRFNTETSEQGQPKQKTLKRGSSSTTHIRQDDSLKRDNSKNRTNKFQLEKKIQEAESMLNNSRNSIKRSVSRNSSLKNISNINNGSNSQIGHNSNSSTKRSNSITKSSKQLDQAIVNHNEVQIMNKKVMQMKKQSEQDRQQIIKERLRNNELQEEIDKLNRKMKKMANQIEKSTALDDDYKKLMQSFEKSEYIRQQQKQLITNLKNELDYYKKNFPIQPYHNNSVNYQQDQVQVEKKRPKSKSKHSVS